MDKFKIIIEVDSTEETVKAIIEYFREDFPPEKFKHSFNKSNLSYEIKERSFHGYDSEDIQSCAFDHGYGILTPKEIEKVFDVMEKRFDANWGVNWDYINFCIKEVK